MTQLVPYGTEPRRDRRLTLAQQSMRLAALNWPDRRREALDRMGAVVAERKARNCVAAVPAVAATHTHAEWAALYWATLSREFNARARSGSPR